MDNATATKNRDRARSYSDADVRRRAVQFSSPDLNAWSESVAASLMASVSRYVSSGDVTDLHEALVLADSMPVIIEEQIDRALRRF